MKWLTLLTMLALVSACATKAAICNGSLRPINPPSTPMAGAAEGAPAASVPR